MNTFSNAMINKNKISCIITDDEPFARKGLQGYVEKVGFLHLAGICEDALELKKLLEKEVVDLLFLDIEMPYMSGIELIKNIDNPPKVIFTTAYEKYAITGFELDVLDYLLKPISFERFLKSANKAYDYFRSAGSEEEEVNYIFIKTDNKLEKIDFDEILFAEAMENYVGIYTRTKKMVTHSTLKRLIETLPSKNFIQPHKSFLVNMNAISSIEGNLINIEQYQVPISKYQKEIVLQKILNNKLLNK